MRSLPRLAIAALVLAALVAPLAARAESPDAPNDIPGTPLPSAQPVAGTVNFTDGGDNDDVYSTKIAAGQWFWVQLRGDSGTDFDLALFGPTARRVTEGPVLTYSERHGTSTEFLRYKASAETTAFVDVFAFGGKGAYTLTYGRPTTEIAVSATAVKTVSWESTTSISGKVTRIGNGAAVGAEPLYLYKKVYGAEQYEYAQKLKTKADGTYAFTVTPKKKTYYRVLHLGTANYITPKNASTLTITPYARLTRPSAPTAVTHGKTWVASGYLEPRHPAGGRDVKVRIYKYDDVLAEYVYVKTFSATNYDYSSTTTRYKATVSIPTSGKWRMRAYIAGDSKHAATYSTYRYREVQ